MFFLRLEQLCLLRLISQVRMYFHFWDSIVNLNRVAELVLPRLWLVRTICTKRGQTSSKITIAEVCPLFFLFILTAFKTFINSKTRASPYASLRVAVFRARSNRSVLRTCLRQPSMLLTQEYPCKVCSLLTTWSQTLSKLKNRDRPYFVKQKKAALKYKRSAPTEKEMTSNLSLFGTFLNRFICLQSEKSTL